MSANGRPIPEMTEKDLRRFWSKVSLPDPETGCMVWLAGTDDRGYGRFHLARTAGGPKYRAHRVAFTLAEGPIPAGMVLDHFVCQNKACVSPLHLRVCTQAENASAPDGAAGKHAAKSHCPRGHRYDEGNTRKRRSGRICKTCHRDQERARYARKNLQKAA